MDSEHRHELKKNELAEGLTHPAEFFKEHKSTILMVIIAILVVIAWYMRKIPSQVLEQSKLAKNAEATMLIQEAIAARINKVQGNAGGVSLQGMALQLDEASENYDGNVAAMLLIQKGNTLRADIHYTSGEMDQSTMESRIDRARKAYQEAISKAAGSVNEDGLIANARIGLALCHEELGEYEEASRIYEEIAADENLQSTVFSNKARMRLDSLGDYQGTYVFVDAPEPEEEEAEIPAPMPVNPDAILEDVLRNAPETDDSADEAPEDDKDESLEPK